MWMFALLLTIRYFNTPVSGVYTPLMDLILTLFPLPKKATLMRGYITPNERVPKEQSYKFARGTTAYLKEAIIEKKDLKKFVTIVDLAASGGATAGDVMEIDA